MSKDLISYPPSNDKIFRGLTTISAILIGSVLMLILVFLVKESFSFLLDHSLIEFLFTNNWRPSQGDYGAMALCFGSLLVAVFALAISAPISFFSATYLAFFAPNLVRVGFTRLIEVLAGIPSVIFGLWGLLKIVPLISEHITPGTNLIVAAVILALMITPTMTLLLERSFRDYPSSIIESGLATGMSLDDVVFKIVAPTSLRAFTQATTIGFGRAIGETMAVMMVAGNVVQIPESVFSSFRTLTANIALEMPYALNDHRQALFACGLLLTIVILGLSLLPRGFER